MPATAQEASTTPIEITQAWSRATPPGARVGVGYLEIANVGLQDDRLLSAETARARAVEIHSMSVADGVMRMEPMEEGLEIAAGETLALAPGGYHLMLIDIGDPLAAGESVPVTLTFESAGPVEAVLSVGPLGARGPEGSAPAHAH